MKKIFLRDYQPLTEYQETPEGYLVVTADRVARTGVQEYFGFENDTLADIARRLGKSNNEPIRVYRAAEEVFSDATVNAWAHKPVTVMHPDKLVGPENYSDYAVGEVSTEATISEDKKWFGLKMVVKKKSEIDAIKDGKYPETSAGYTANIVIDNGVTPDGEQFDARQTDITPNHMAFVPNGRAFSDRSVSAENWGAAPITKKEEVKMTDLKTVVIGDKAVQVAAADADTITKLIAENKTAIDAKNEEIGTLKAECADANAKVLDADAIEALVQSRIAVIDKARTMVADYDATGKSVEDIRREVVKSVHGDEAAAETVTDAEVKGIFDFATAKSVDDKMRKALGDAKKTEVTDNGQAAYEARLSNAWKGK